MRLILTFVLFSVLLAAQNTITVTASRSTSTQADQVVLSADVSAPLDFSHDDVLAALQGSILSSANFSNVRTTYQLVSPDKQSESLIWTFLVTAPLANFKSTIAQFTALQQILAQKKNGMSLSYSVYGTQMSPQAQQPCSTADLLNDARAQALKMASAAGAGVGSVLAMSGSAVSQSASGALFSNGALAPGCSLTVKFALTGF
jgi:hypothetical protein